MAVKTAVRDEAPKVTRRLCGEEPLECRLSSKVRARNHLYPSLMIHVVGGDARLLFAAAALAVFAALPVVASDSEAVTAEGDAGEEAKDGLARVVARGELTWGADAHGGAPYVFQDADDPTHLIGFEVDLADAIGKKLGVRATLVQGPWDKLLDLLDRGNFDIALNGIEESDEKRTRNLLSVPYYVAAQKITRSKDGHGDFASLDDVKGLAVGCLTGAAACKILDDKGAMTRAFDVQDDIYKDIVTGRSVAALADEPIAHYYGDIDDRLVTLPGVYGELRYVGAFRSSDHSLKAAVDTAIADLAREGTLRAIYEKWGMWNAPTAALLRSSVGSAGSDEDVDGVARSHATGFEAWRAAVGTQPPFFERVVKRYPPMMPLFARGAALTLGVSVLAMLLAIALGMLLAVGRAYGPAPVRWFCVGYVELFRGTPLLVQLTMIYFGLPELGLTLSPFVAGVVALGLNYAAAESENYRAGLLSVPRAQLDAARSLGLSTTQALRHVLLPQAARIALPPMTNDFIALLKDSSLVSVVALTELTKVYGVLGNSTRDHLGLGVVVAAWYLVVGLPFVFLARRVEARLGAHASTTAKRGGR